MIRFGMMLGAAVAILTAGGSAYAKMAVQTFAVLAGAGRTMSFRRRTAPSGSPRNPRASSAGSIPGPASRI
jgi:hypothetical protein